MPPFLCYQSVSRLFDFLSIVKNISQKYVAQFETFVCLMINYFDDGQKHTHGESQIRWGNDKLVIGRSDGKMTETNQVRFEARFIMKKYFMKTHSKLVYADYSFMQILNLHWIIKLVRRMT